MPKRIQRSRKKGWRKPEGAVIVDRTSRWGNPFKVGDLGIPDNAAAVEAFEHYTNISGTADDISKLQGKDLICFCTLDQPCHADVLLRLANPETKKAHKRS